MSSAAAHQVRSFVRSFTFDRVCEIMRNMTLIKYTSFLSTSLLDWFLDKSQWEIDSPYLKGKGFRTAATPLKTFRAIRNIYFCCMWMNVSDQVSLSDWRHFFVVFWGRLMTSEAHQFKFKSKWKEFHWIFLPSLQFPPSRLIKDVFNARNRFLKGHGMGRCHSRSKGGQNP